MKNMKDLKKKKSKEIKKKSRVSLIFQIIVIDITKQIVKKIH
jgi:hypothetical protein